MARRTTFTTIPNEIITDDRLDWKDLGLLCYLLSKPDNWETHPNHLIKQRKTGRDGLYSILKNLKEYGYVVFQRNSDGSTSWVITEEPQTGKPDVAIKPHTEKPYREKPYRDNPDDIVKTDHVVKTEGSVKTEAHSPKNQTLPADIDTELWTEFMKSRKRLKASSSEVAIKILLTTLDKCVAAGFTRNEAISEAIERGWKSVKPEWLKNSVKSNQSFSEQKNERRKAAGEEWLNGGHVINSTCETVQ